MINVPSAIRQLAFENVANAAPLQLRVHFAAPMHEKDVIRAEGAIDNQLAAPMAIWLLLAQQVLLRARDRTRDLFVRSPNKTPICLVARSATQSGSSTNSGMQIRSYEALRSWFCALPGDVTVTGAHAIESENFAATAGAGFGFAPKLNLIVFHVSPRCACSPNVAVGS